MRRGRPCPASGARLHAGFTLLEVLAAFLIFAVLFTVLAGTASQAFRSEGTNRRRLEASLLADEKLAELLESTPKIGEESEEEDIFFISTSVSPLDADMLGIDLTPERDDRRDSRGSRDDDTPTSILAPKGPQEESPLLRIDLLIEWEEGEHRLAVRRSTIALDLSSLESAFSGGGGGGGGDSDSSLGDDSDSGGGDIDPDDCGDDPIQCMINALQNAK
jgi:prepilin-type N-terminal cleavage/methylation domain-containing protein